MEGYDKRGGYGTWAEPVTQSTTFRFLYRLKILNVYAMCTLGRWEGMMRGEEGGASVLNQFHKVQTFRFLYSQNVHFVQFETPTA